MSLDPAYRASVEVASGHHLPHSRFLGWDVSDRDAEFALAAYTAQRCPDCGVHPSMWRVDDGGHPNAVAPTWVYCRVCEQIEAARKAPPHRDSDGNAAPGWRLELQLNEDAIGGEQRG